MGRLVAITAGIFLVAALLAGLKIPNAPLLLAGGAGGVAYPMELFAIVIADVVCMLCGLSLVFGMGIDRLTKTLGLVFATGLVLFLLASSAEGASQIYIQVAGALLVATMGVLLLSGLLVVAFVWVVEPMMTSERIHLRDALAFLKRHKALSLTCGICFLSLSAAFAAAAVTQQVTVLTAIAPFLAVFTVGLLTSGVLVCIRWVAQHFSIGQSFPIFVGWTLLRSHRSAPTLTSQLKGSTFRWRRAGGTRWALLGLLFLGAALFLTRPIGFEASSGATGPAWTYLLSSSLFILGGCALLFAVPGLLPARSGEAPPRVYRRRNWVSLPTFMSIVGVSLGVWALIVVLSVMDGFASDLQEKIVRTNAHVLIEPTRGTGVIGDSIVLADRLSQIDNIRSVHGYVTGEVMISSPQNVMVNVVVKGLSREAYGTSEELLGKISSGAVELLWRPEELVSDFHTFSHALRPMDSGLGGVELHIPADIFADDGEGMAPVDPSATIAPRYLSPGILLGAELAKSLGVEVGQSVQVLTPDGDVGPTGLRPKVKNFKVTGTFVSGMYEYDQKMAYMLLSDAQRFFNLDADANRVEIHLHDATQTDETLRAIRDILSAHAPHLQAMDWKQRNRSLFTALELEKIAMFIVLGFIVLVSSLLIVSSLVMIIVERVRDIAVLKALGASNRTIVKSFILMGGFIGVLGVLSGATLGIITLEAILGGSGMGLPTKEYYLDRVPYQLDMSTVGLVGLSAIAVCLLATIYPSMIANKLKTIEGLRHE